METTEAADAGGFGCTFSTTPSRVAPATGEAGVTTADWNSFSSGADRGGQEPAGEAHESGGRPTAGEPVASATGKHTRARPRCATPEAACRLL